MIEYVVPSFLCVIPIVLYILFWRKVNRFRKDEENIKCFRKLREIDCETNIPRNKPEIIKAIIAKNRRKGKRENAIYSDDRNTFLKKYESIYRCTKIYIVLTWIILCIWMVTVAFLTIKSRWKYDITLLLYLIDGICLVGLGLPPILKSSKRKRIQCLGERIDDFVETCLDEDGIVKKCVLHISAITIVLELLTIVFYFYFKYGLLWLSSLSNVSRLMQLVILLGVFRYPGLWLFSKFFRPICSLVLNPMVHGKCKKQRVRKKYIESIIRNNMYLIFMLFHIVGTDLIIDVSLTEVQITIEAIGIIYLIDTYIVNMKEMIKKEPMFEDPEKEQLPSE